MTWRRGDDGLGRRFRASSSAIFLLMALAGSFVGLSGSNAEGEYILHEAITIIGDSGFTAENGVVSGMGTPYDPFVISGWEIASSPEQYTLRLSDTLRYVIIRDCYFHAWTYYGLDLRSVRNVRIENCTISDSTFGVSGLSVFDCAITDNYIHVMDMGVQIIGGDDLLVSSNTIELESELYNAISIQELSKAAICDNVMPEVGVYFWGNLPQWTSLVMSGNVAGGRPIISYSDMCGLNISSGSFGQLFVWNCMDIRITGLLMSGSNELITVAFCSNVTVENSGFFGHSVAVHIEQSEFVRAVNNTFSSAGRGLALFNCDEVLVAGNNVTGGGDAIILPGCRNFTVIGNDMMFVYTGLYCIGASYGVVAHNRIWHTTLGVSAYYCPYPYYYEEESDHVRFFGNSFIGNTYVSNDRSPLNWWNESYPIGGNYYDAYDGVDEMSGPLQDTPGSDGIGDTPFSITPSLADSYPLMTAPGLPSGAPFAGFRVNPVGGSMTTEFVFDASLSWDAEDGVDGLQYRWDWEGDGTWDTEWSTDILAYHQFSFPGNYTVRLEVRDTDGFTDTEDENVEVWEVVPEFKALVVPVLLLLLVVVILRSRPRRAFRQRSDCRPPQQGAE